MKNSLMCSVSGVTAMFAVMGVGAVPSEASAQDRSISKSANGSTIVLTASGERFAGAIASLRYRGVEYIDIADHGRQMQSAIQLDEYGECWNPNEAGSRRDGTKFTSESDLQFISSSGNVLRTQTRPAFWLSANEHYGRDCNPALPNRGQRAINTVAVSNFILNRTSQFHSNAIPNVIDVNVSWTMASSHAFTNTEASTGYLPHSFRTFLTYDRAQRRLTKVVATPQDSPAQHTRLPVIIAQANGRHAMGAWSPAIMTGTPRSYMAYFDFFDDPNPTTKWACVFGQTNVRQGEVYSYSCPVAVGTVDEVISAINRYPVPGQQLGSMIPIYRFYRYPKHFMTKSYTEGANAGFTFETTGYRAFASGGSGRRALYRCYNPQSGGHFVSSSSGCEGFRQEGTLGYAANQAASGLVPLYRFYRANTADHLITVTFQEGLSGGYRYEGILGYVAS